MNTLSTKIGYWSAILLTISFIAWIVSFIGISVTSPLFFWTNFSDYLAYEHNHNQYFQNTARFFMLIFGPLYVMLINSFYDYASGDKKSLVRISLIFATAFAILSSLHYFVQLSAVRINIEHGQIAGLEHFVQANPNSIMSSINMLGWTFFLGLSSFFTYPIFSGSKVKRIIRYAFIANGISCIVSGIGFLFQINVITFLFLNLGLGGAMMTITITSIKFLKLELSKLHSAYIS